MLTYHWSGCLWAEFLCRNTYILHIHLHLLYISSAPKWLMCLKSFPMQHIDLLILQSEYHQSWWPSNARSQSNSSHYIYLVLLEYSWIFLNEHVWISIEVSLKFVPKGPINNIPALVQIMAWRRPGDKPLSEPMMVSLLTDISVTRPQRVNSCTHWWCGVKITEWLIVS